MRKYLLYIIVIVLAPSCTVLKCRYSGGWQVGLDRRVEFPAQKQRKKIAQTDREVQQHSDSTIHHWVAQFDPELTIDRTLQSAHMEMQMHSMVRHANLKQVSSRDSSKNRRKRAQQNDRYVRKKNAFDWYDWIPDNQSEFALFLVLIGLILAVVIVWGIFELFRWLIRLIFQKREHFPDDSTLIANNKDIAKQKGSEPKTVSGEEESMANKLNTDIDDVVQVSDDISEEDAQVKKADNKSKLLNFLAVFIIGFVVFSIMALGMRNK